MEYIIETKLKITQMLLVAWDIFHDYLKKLKTKGGKANNKKINKFMLNKSQKYHLSRRDRNTWDTVEEKLNEVWIILNKRFKSKNRRYSSSSRLYMNRWRRDGVKKYLMVCKDPGKEQNIQQ